MADYYIIAVVVLFALAITDLVVGVSNDAVNFLNSALGSKVAPRFVILIIASLGVFIGATFSSGMMEIARKGIFNPTYFYYSEIMVLFLAVMLTDIILLDVFNSLGMPTSTTVSIVFEILGAAVVISLFKLFQQEESLSQLGNYINVDKAVKIISGIFLSVLVAFSVGATVQYFTRMLMSFQYKKRLKFVGALWGGLAISAISYFLLIKGLKGASFVDKSFLNYIKENTLVILSVSFVGWAIIMQVLTFFKVNVLKVVVLFGTFSLAMAFAGNDLVNFIGVPIAGFESYLLWSESGVPANEFLMTALAQPVRTDTYLLIAAGAIMVTTLWTSKKARTVSETELNLGRQDEGAERFNPNLASRGIVKGARGLGQALVSIIPNGLYRRIESNFIKEETVDSEAQMFDLVRASVNLTVASVLIAIATSMKLPLSTTYVSFMVAMGSSLSDRAWDRESAVYRVAGVFNVIGGWLMTAVIAFSIAAIFATIVYWLEFPGMILLVLTAAAALTRSFLSHRKKQKRKDAELAIVQDKELNSFESAFSDMQRDLLDSLNVVQNVYVAAIQNLITEDEKELKKSRTYLEELNGKHTAMKGSLVKWIKKTESDPIMFGSLYVRILDLFQEAVQSLQLIQTTAQGHVENSHKPLKPTQVDFLDQLEKEITTYLSLISKKFESGDFSDIGEILSKKKAILEFVQKGLDDQFLGIKAKDYGNKNSTLMFTLLLETKDIAAVSARIVRYFHDQEKRLKEVGS